MYTAPRILPFNAHFSAKILHLLLLLGCFSGYAQIVGCTDIQATNYNAEATVNNGGCIYEDTIVTPSSSIDLPGELLETSGLLFWNNQLLTHNDSEDTNLYAVNPENGKITEQFPLDGMVNTDWEEITQDQEFIYIGDFGNNLSGNRKDLKILRVSKKSLLQKKPAIDTINFSYTDQTDFSPKSGNTTDYDCEAFFATSDSLYLITKQWTGQRSKIYTLPKNPGNYKAQFKTEIDVQGLTTGAAFVKEINLLVLSGYGTSLEPFLFLIYDFQAFDFKTGNKRKLRLELPFAQVEGIATQDGRNFYLTNEYFAKPPFVNSPQRLHLFNLNSYLSEYYEREQLKEDLNEKATGLIIYPQPTTGLISIAGLPFASSYRYQISGVNGELLQLGTLEDADESIDLSPFSNGIYFLKLDNQKAALKIVKR
ncbi:T9SS type A sorting domain-containing protein [Flavimarina sp. Hel_I_48]|uniref:T9SS type A sorting domain-containing protein n=1 Tax=Flavimarina sp. Hel_I_48 TaxID=1392488 RepID=UPI0013D8EE69|nr:T9SS type A sorting domain-containing protein [Flavimarina sp. Hel_I_48]